MKRNQIVYNAPKLGPGQVWRVDRYLVGGHAQKCPRKFEEFSEVQFVNKSSGAYHFIGDGKFILVCSIQFK